MNSQIRNEISMCIKGTQRQWVMTNSSTTVPKRLTTVPHSAAVHGTSQLVVTSTAAPNLQVNDWANVTFTTNTSLNGRYRISAVTSTTFTLAVKDTVADLGNVDSDIATLYVELPFTSALLRGQKAIQTANTGDVAIGTSSTDGNQPDVIQSGQIWNLTPSLGRYWDLADWYVDVATANDGLVITFD